MRRIIFLSAALFAVILSRPVASDQKKVTALETAPVFDDPVHGLLARSFIDKGDTCGIDSSLVDSAGAAWFRTRIDREKDSRKNGGWVLARAFRLVADVPQNLMSNNAAGDQDKKRRLEILKTHQQWPRRIIQAVRSGRICLDMTEEQVVAAWGAFAEKHASYMVGVGEYLILVYGQVGTGILGVMLQNGRVVGWTTDD